MDVPEVKAMVELYPIGQIFDNHVYPGVLHNAFMDVGIPSFTPEIGAARVLAPIFHNAALIVGSIFAKRRIGSYLRWLWGAVCF
jgi:predicted deacylase